MKLIPKVETSTALSPGCLIMYENDGVPILGVITAYKKQRYVVLNDRGRELELESARLVDLPEKIPSLIESTEERVKFLTALRAEAESLKTSIDLEEIWSFFKDEGASEIETSTIAKNYFGSDTLKNHIALRFALLSDKFYFKRRKEFFTARPEEVVTQLKRTEEQRIQKLETQERLYDLFRALVKDREIALPKEAEPTLRLLEDIAVSAPGLDQAAQDEGKDLVDRLSQVLGVHDHGRLEEKAFAILEKIHHFHENTNLSITRHRPYINFSDACIEEAKAITTPRSWNSLSEDEKRTRRDLTSLYVFTIDDESTQDMDDGLSFEEIPHGYRIGVHIADVTSAISPTSELDREAKNRGTSIYLPERVINMFPEILAEDKLSLRKDTYRLCVTCFIELSRDLKIQRTEIVPSFVKIAERFTYNQVDDILERGFGGENDPPFQTLYSFAVDHEEIRHAAGGMRINKHDVNVVIGPNYELSLVEIDENSPSRSIISEMAILANSCFAEYAVANNFPLVFRGQEMPEGEDAQLSSIPDGPARDYAIRSRLKRSYTDIVPCAHSTLGLRAYAQITSPIRRYLDLINQRQIVEFLTKGTPKYSGEELLQIIGESEEPLSVANSLSRESKRFWLLKYLQKISRTKSKFTGVVTRVDLKNPIVELDVIHLSLPVRFKKPPALGSHVEFKISALQPLWDYVKLEEI